VILHVHAIHNPGEAIVAISRLENGKVVEHWDVEPIPETGANDNTMF